ncbi:MAG: exo-alpha-sialidase [Verrucomicrobia bacterium]|jgi:predicted neuraminidase|nr:exo-alpha-sialidase [Verrucomicrobiota bacterium]
MNIILGMLFCFATHGATLKSDILNLPSPYNDTPCVIETKEGLLLVWASGSRPGYSDVTIQKSHWIGNSWSTPTIAASYAAKRSGARQACWNPVLTKASNGQLALFYQVGLSRESWEGRMKISYDDGYSWTQEIKIPKGYHGPIKNKGVELPNGKLLCPSATATAGWRVHLEFVNPFRENWGFMKTKPLNFPGEYRATEPAILIHDDKVIQVLCRTKQGYLTEFWSDNGAKSWFPMKRSPLPAPNSGFDAIKLRDGRFVVVYNHSTKLTDRINVAMSVNGRDWEAVAILNQSPSEHFQNPSIAQTKDDRLHIAFTVNQNRFQHVQMDPSFFKGKPIVNGIWPIQ